MATIYRTATLTVPPDVAWRFLDRYTRSEVHVFANCVSERQVDDFRVVVTADGMELWEQNITVDGVHRRAVYTVPGIPGIEHHQAEMRIDVEPDGRATLVWITDLLPHALADTLSPVYDTLFADLVAAVEASGDS
jgi:hypothetical protein